MEIYDNAVTKKWRSCRKAY